MLSSLLQGITEFSVISRGIYYFTHIPSVFPEFRNRLFAFATNGKKDAVVCATVNEKSFLALSSNLVSLYNLTGQEDLWKEIHDGSLEEGKFGLGIVLLSKKTTCRLCCKELTPKTSRVVNVIVYHESRGSFMKCRIPKICSNRSCKLIQHYGYYTIGESKFYDEDWHENDYLLSSGKTAFDMQLIRKFEVEILLGKLSFKEKADIYNEVNGYDALITKEDEEVHEDCRKEKQQGLRLLKEELRQRCKLDRRRLEEGLLLYWSLKKVQEYQLLQLRNMRIPADLDELIAVISPLFHDGFIKKWITHQCDVSGCKKNLVLDGNFDNNRECCMAKGSGYIEYDSLPGEIKTGCTQTPKLGTRFCVKHLVDHQELDKLQKPNLQEFAVEFGENLGPILRSAKKKLAAGDWGQVGDVLEMKTLRHKKFFKVRWIGKNESVTWEPEENVPTIMRENFEKGERETMVTVWDTEKVYGTTYTKSYQVPAVTAKSKVKRRRVGNDNSFGNAFADTEEDKVEKCKTEKSKHIQRKNFRTAGTFFGMRPCGIILFAYELFISESKSQVYGILHDVMSKWEFSETARIIYDDACHLKKFCTNPVWSGLTNVSRKLGEIDMVVDKLHFRNHVDKWCKENCNPYDRIELEGVDTEICEQTFAWFSKYGKITQHMNQHRFLFYILILCDLKNKKIEKKRNVSC